MGTTIGGVDMTNDSKMFFQTRKSTNSSMNDFSKTLSEVVNSEESSRKNCDIDVRKDDCVKNKSENKFDRNDEENNSISDVKESEDNLESQEKNSAEESKECVDEKDVEETDIEQAGSDNVKEQDTINVLDEKLTDDVSLIDKLDNIIFNKQEEEDIVNALELILQQIRQVLGVEDVQIQESMQNLEMTSIDLINPEKIAQLVADLSGEESTIGFIADENMYNSLQELTASVETILDELVSKTGLEKESILEGLDVPIELFDKDITQDLQIDQVVETEDTDIIDMAVENKVENDFEVVSEVKAFETKESEDINSKSLNIEKNSTEGITQNDTTVEISKTDDSEADSDKSTESGNDNLSGNGQAQGFNSDLENIEALTTDNDAVLDKKAGTEAIIRQLADFVKINSGKEITEMELQLHPASLGTVNVQLATKGGNITAQFTTENETVRAAIEAQATQLQLDLEEQGIKIDAIEVTVASHQMEKNLEEGNKDNNQDRQDDRNNKVNGIRRKSINLRAFETDSEIAEEMQNVDDATRVAMEMMRMHGNSISLLA
ncbi:MAG: flagellar hook-length control protein FliK [Lachnospiraceae bacterium]|nr:flagellar hook-length control protein FliK [Lachnospiraceae bacterium]